MATRVMREVLREFEKRRGAASAKKESRLDEVYSKSPRIKEIDEEIATHGISISRAILDGKDAAAVVSALTKESEALLAEKASILKSLGLPENYLNDVHTCPLCQDSGFHKNARCSCFTRRLIEEQTKFSGLHKILSKENFESFDIGLFSDIADKTAGQSPRDAAARSLSIAAKFAENFENKFQNLLFYGKTGLGKTFLCNCIAKALLDKGRSVIYLTSPHLFAMVEKVKFDKDGTDDLKEVLDFLPLADLLIIDDLGTEVHSIVTASWLFSLLNIRLLEERHTIISTNFDISEINEIYSDRITSRIWGNYTACKFVGEDLRIKIRYGK